MDLLCDRVNSSACQGLEIASLAPPYVVVKEVLGEEIAHRVVFLSGPSFAAEVVDKQPTMVVAASQDEKRAEMAQMVCFFVVFFLLLFRLPCCSYCMPALTPL